MGKGISLKDDRTTENELDQSQEGRKELIERLKRDRVKKRESSVENEVIEMEEKCQKSWNGKNNLMRKKKKETGNTGQDRKY